MNTVEPEPPPLTVADLADMERRADITDTIDYVCDESTMADLRRLLTEVKRIHAKIHERAAVIQGTPVDDAELAAIRTAYENHLARGNYVHPMTHDIGRLLAAIDEYRGPRPNTCPACTGRSRETTHMICMECGTDYTAEPPRRITPHGLEVLREALAEVKRLRARHAEPVPDWFRGGSRVPTDMSTDSYSHAVASAAAGLLVHIDATPYAYPEVGQDPADFARDQLAHVAAAALWTLVAHAVGTGGDDHHLETFTQALINTDRLPAAAVEPLAPAFAQLLDAALPAIIASINPPDGPEAIS